MKTSICVLNLSPADRDDRLRLHRSTFSSLPRNRRAEPVRSIEQLSQIPDGTDAPWLILYIVAHGVPNGIKSRRRIISEAELADAIIEKRGNAPTLIVWDICFAKSLLDISQCTTGASKKIRGKECGWPSSYVHIFSCDAHERTWQLGPGTPSGAQTLFSQDLHTALAAGAIANWSELETRLQDQLAPIQTPFIHPKDGLQPGDFNLGVSQSQSAA